MTASSVAPLTPTCMKKRRKKRNTITKRMDFIYQKQSHHFDQAMCIFDLAGNATALLRDLCSYESHFSGVVIIIWAFCASATSLVWYKERGRKPRQSRVGKWRPRDEIEQTNLVVSHRIKPWLAPCKSLPLWEIQFAADSLPFASGPRFCLRSCMIAISRQPVFPLPIGVNVMLCDIIIYYDITCDRDDEI